MGGGDDGGRGGEVGEVAVDGLGRRLGGSRSSGGGGDNGGVEAELVEDLDEVLEVVARDFEAALLGLNLLELGGILLDRALVLELRDLSRQLADLAEQYGAFVLDHVGVCVLVFTGLAGGMGRKGRGERRLLFLFLLCCLWPCGRCRCCCKMVVVDFSRRLK